MDLFRKYDGQISFFQPVKSCADTDGQSSFEAVSEFNVFMKMGRDVLRYEDGAGCAENSSGRFRNLFFLYSVMNTCSPPDTWKETKTIERQLMRVFRVCL